MSKSIFNENSNRGLINHLIVEKNHRMLSVVSLEKRTLVITSVRCNRTGPDMYSRKTPVWPIQFLVLKKKKSNSIFLSLHVFPDLSTGNLELHQGKVLPFRFNLTLFVLLRNYLSSAKH